jgi:hypothetical protein
MSHHLLQGDSLCKRSDDDPLVRVLTDRYKLNVLRQPRRGVGVGELLVKEGKDLRCAGSVSRLFDPPLEILLQDSVVLADVEGVISARRSASAAGAPLTGLLAALGVAGVSSIGASLRAARDVTISYSLTGIRYQCTNLVSLGEELSTRALRRGNSLYHPGRDFFIAHAVAEATGIQVRFSSATDRAGSLGLEVAAAIKADASVDIIGDHSGRLIISSEEPVAFGLAVVQMRTDGSSLLLDSVDRTRPVRGEGSSPHALDEVGSVFFGGPDGEVLVEIG